MPGGHHPERRELVTDPPRHQGQFTAVAGRALDPAPPSPVPHPLLPDLERLVTPLAEASGLAVTGVHIQAHRLPLTLVVEIRHADGRDVNLDDCAAFSGVLGEAVEAGELMTEAYVLEVSSPGIGEELLEDRDFRSFRGFPVAVSFRDAKGMETTREGLLLERDDQTVQLNRRGRISRIPRQDVISVRLVTPEG
jgi:ribosome maturation factor RimP